MSSLARDDADISGVEVQKSIDISDPEVEQSSNVFGIELLSAYTERIKNNERGGCWSYNVSVQFPAKTIKTKNGTDEVEVNQPHEGYFIKTTMKDSKMNFGKK